MQCRHLNGDALDNNVDNLAWGTPAQNYDDRAKHGRERRGEDHHKAKLSVGQVRELRRLRATGVTYPALAVKFGIAVSHAHRIANSESWRHVDGR